MDANRNYIRAESLSVNSLEMYMLLILLCAFVYIAVKVKKSTDIKLIYMYILAMPYTDIVYRIFNVQICEIIIMLMIVYDFYKGNLRLLVNPVIKFMLFFSGILWVSSLSSIAGSMSGLIDADLRITGISPVLNNVKFMLLIYAASKILYEVRNQEALHHIMHLVRIGGNLTASATIAQAVLYKMGFTVAGIFEMLNFPRAKGLSHEPGTNAFILLTSLALSTVTVSGGRIRVYKMSLALQLAAFILCFSAGAIPVFALFCVIFLIKLTHDGFIPDKILHMILFVFLLSAAALLVLSAGNSAQIISYTLEKIKMFLSDYLNRTNFSGRGTDIWMIDILREKTGLFFGTGAFSSTIIFSEFPCTNMYIILLCEIGIAGCMLLTAGLVCFTVSLRSFGKKAKDREYLINCSAYLLVSFIAVAWLRVLFFHQIWFVLAVYFAVCRFKDKETIRKQGRILNENIDCYNKL